MAENEDVNVDDGQTSEGEGKKKSKKGLFIAIGVGVLLMVGAIGVGVVLGNKARPEREGPIKKGAIPIMITFSDMYVNIAETRATRVLKMTVSLSLSEATLQPVIEAHRPIIVDMISEIASLMTIEELEGRSGRGILKREIKNRINDLLHSHGSGAVDDVYFTDFLIQ